MPSEQPTETSTVQGWIDRLREGDLAARDQLLQQASQRLERLTRKMLRDYPGVQRWEQTDDVLQNALVRLCRSLGEIAPETTRDFFRLAAAQIRRELIDLARKYRGPFGLGTNYASQAGFVSRQEEGSPSLEAAEVTNDPSRLAEWTAFHQAVEQMPAELRDVFDLVYYQGLEQAEAAVLLRISERTLKRRWQMARLALHDQLGGRLPGI
jgi:RNA polymerase sigma factor (sigma-70 family)